MARRAAPHRGIDVHYGDSPDSTEADDATESRPSKTQLKQQSHDLQTTISELREIRKLASERLVQSA